MLHSLRDPSPCHETWSSTVTKEINKDSTVHVTDELFPTCDNQSETDWSTDGVTLPLSIIKSTLSPAKLLSQYFLVILFRSDLILIFTQLKRFLEYVIQYAIEVYFIYICISEVVFKTVIHFLIGYLSGQIALARLFSFQSSFTGYCR